MTTLKKRSQPDRGVLVVIPAKNEEKSIPQCLQAVLSQKYSPFEIVVVDNGSTDNTRERVNRTAGVTLLVKQEGTISSVRNLGAKFSTSKYIAFLDGDCVPPDSWLQTGVELLQEEEVACVGFPAKAPCLNESWVATTWHMMSSSAKHEGTCYVEWLSSFNLILKRSAFEKISGFDESLETCEDFDLGMRLNKHARLIFNDQLTIQHLGVVSSLGEFFRKELWRGKSNLQQLKTNKEGLKGNLGVFIPVFYVLATSSLCLATLYNPLFAIPFILMLLGLPFAFALRRLKEKQQIRFLPKMMLLAGLYLFARGLAIVGHKS